MEEDYRKGKATAVITRQVPEKKNTLDITTGKIIPFRKKCTNCDKTFPITGFYHVDGIPKPQCTVCWDKTNGVSKKTLKLRKKDPTYKKIRRKRKIEKPSNSASLEDFMK